MRLKIIHHAAGEFFALQTEDGKRLIQRSGYASSSADMERAENEIRLFARGYVEGMNDARSLISCHVHGGIEEWKAPE